ncbi:splicing factor 3A subunit 2-like protein [Populus alba x Populus x berolinensis]|nr:splicing factor 3A subunit 2-like protein [Populus alba x Populus x berolinensis]
MLSWMQRIEATDKRFQYLLFSAEPYEIIAFKVPSTEIDKSTPKFFSHWDPDSKMFTSFADFTRVLCNFVCTKNMKRPGSFLDFTPLRLTYL